MQDLNRQVVVVTGASSGIGAALAVEASLAGARVVLAARRQERLERVARDCAGESFVLATDLTVGADRRALVDRTLERFQRIDILVNNAGLGAYAHFLETDQKTWRSLFEINLFAPVLLTRLVVPHMLEKASGLVVNLASIGGLLAHSDRVSAYVASKHAIVGFTRGLAKDLDGSGVRVLAACPHLTDTDFFDTSAGAGEMATVVDRLRPSMDSASAVARGILAQLDSDKTVVFPTDSPARAYAKQKDL
jgi:short-subunit dehydrogenase